MSLDPLMYVLYHKNRLVKGKDWIFANCALPLKEIKITFCHKVEKEHENRKYIQGLGTEEKFNNFPVNQILILVDWRNLSIGQKFTKINIP